jgi:glucose-6-phosphate 1-dehydrogenase
VPENIEERMMKMSSVLNPVTDGTVFFIFGATGDLAKRKLYPAIYSMYREGKLKDRFAVIGLARRPKTQEEFRADVHESIRSFARYKDISDEEWADFAEHFEYLSLDTKNTDGFKSLLTLATSLEQKFNIPGNRMFYLALAPELFGTVAQNLKAGGLLTNSGWKRLVIEKPFGYNRVTAESLNLEITSVFDESEIYRIDHYLGKEMVQNIEAMRFANMFFEPLWNNKYIANIQITSSETVGVEDRGGYYDKSGALRDMAQNHLLQMVAMMAMEPPSRLQPEAIRDEKVKALRSLRRYESVEEVHENVVRGQYAAGLSNGKQVVGYREEDSVNPESTTETFVAAKVMIDNFRWAGVPFYIRTGKKMAAKSTEIVVEFKNLPDRVHFARKTNLEPNLLVFRVNPLEGIYIKVNVKQPGAEWMIQPVALDFCNSCQIGWNTPEAYERLISDAMRGDSTYFTRWDEVAVAWKFIDRIQDAWGQSNGDLVSYAAGTMGPTASDALLAKDGFKWWPIQGQTEDDVKWETGRS